MSYLNTVWENDNQSLILKDFKYPSGASIKLNSNKRFYDPQICLSGHPPCKKNSIPGCHDIGFLFHKDLPVELIYSILNLTVNRNAAEGIVPPVNDLRNSTHVNKKFSDFIINPVIDRKNSSLLHLASRTNTRPHFYDNSIPSTSTSVQRQGNLPKWHTISEIYPTQNKSSPFTEWPKDIYENRAVRDINCRLPEPQRNSFSITSNANTSASKKYFKKCEKINNIFPESQRNDSYMISNAGTVTAKMSPEPIVNSSKMPHMQVMNSSKQFPNQNSNSSIRFRQIPLEQIKSFSSLVPEQVHALFKTNPTTREKSIPSWRKLEKHAGFSSSNSRIFPETIRNVLGTNPAQVRSHFSGCPLSTTFQETNVKEEFPTYAIRHEKRKRTSFTDDQIQELESHYTMVTKYPSRTAKNQLAANLQLDEKTIGVWFMNRRRKDRRKERKDANQLLTAEIKEESPSEVTM